MTKIIDKYGYYYGNEGNAIKISDMIDVLQQIRNDEGEIYVRTWSDGILKAFEFVEVRSTVDGSETAVVLSV